VKILPVIAEEFPESNHVVHLEMDRDDDLDIWDHARDHDFVIVTKDKDFLQRSVLVGHPPKIVHIRTGIVQPRKLLIYCSRKKDISGLLRSMLQSLTCFCPNSGSSP